MRQGYYPPIFGIPAFHCPYPNCSVFADQTWSERVSFQTDRRIGYGFVLIAQDVSVSRCSRCRQDALWVNGKLIFPESNTAPLPNPDMPEDIQNDYLEAASILVKSPRGAAALLRLTIQKLCIHLGEKGKKIDDDIANLVRSGLPVRIQKALDIVRVIGNNAVHPGLIDLNDNPETVYALFNLINQIVQDRITQPKEIDELYRTLPEPTRQAIEKRDDFKS